MAVGDRAEQHVLGLIERVKAKPLRFRDDQITMAHGGGGKATMTLIEGLLAPAFGIAELADAGKVGGLAVTTDSFVVKPIRFPGGSIGELAVNGTVNDLAVAGALPLALTLSLILEEGLPAEELRSEVEAIASAAAAAGVRIVAGDTKVVERGHCDSMYVTTTGIGRMDERASLSPSSLLPGDRILVSGPIGEHGMAIMLARGEFELDAEIESDTRSLWPVVDSLLEAVGPELRCLRDATRGGAAGCSGRRGSVHSRRHAWWAGERRQRVGSRVGPGRRRPRGGRLGSAGGRWRVRDPRHRSHVRRQRGNARRLRRSRGGRQRTAAGR